MLCLKQISLLFSDYDEFLQDLEEDRDYRAAINIYKGFRTNYIFL